MRGTFAARFATEHKQFHAPALRRFLDFTHE
jgi:hypothetical protein